MSCRAPILACLFSGLALAAFADKTTITVTLEPTEERPFRGDRSAVDVALLLDTSNSMDGLIHQAKTQLWTIVREFAKAERAGKTPQLRVALFEYGNTNLPATEGYIRQVVPFTDDLDELSEALFELQTQGGDEYCGQTIHEALKRLDWSHEPDAYQAIFIAGNEPFSQGPVDFRSACREAIERGVVVNTIHCGSHASGIKGHWQEAARLAEGEYFNIDQDRVQVQIICPQDARILELNTKLNQTYLWFGTREQRDAYQTRQMAQDGMLLETSHNAAVDRTAVKASPEAYRNQGRDLVDALQARGDALDGISPSALPPEMRTMTPAERQDYVQQQATRRAEIQAEIQKLMAERAKHLAHVGSEQPADDTTFGEAVVKAVRQQLTAAGFEMPQ